MRLNKIFSSHMVFSANKPIRIYGNGAGQAKIIFNGIEKNIISDCNEWSVEFEPMNYGGPYELEFVCGSEKTTLDDIFVGEVYLFSGQSNMGMKTKKINVSEDDYHDVNNLRLFSVDRIVGADYFNADDGWVTCKANEAGEWSSLAYLVGRKMACEKNIAIGIIICAQGASIIESWVPKDTFKNIGIDIPIDKKTDSHTTEEYKLWNVEAKLYETELLQAVPFQLSAVVWYQGESDTSYAEACVYDKELCALIDIWRSDFKNNLLPFVVVQLADYCNAPDPEGWERLQNAQCEVQNMRENVKLVVCRDVCENDDIHPKTKQELANRIAETLYTI